MRTLRSLAVALLPAVLAAAAAGCSSGNHAEEPKLGRVLACTMKVSGEWGLWMIYLESGEQKRLAPGTGAAPDWDAEGKRIVWSDGNRVRISAANGDPVAALAGGAGYSPAWSPDGKKVAYGTLNSVQSREVDGADARVWTVADVTCEHPTWSPDGMRIAVTDSKGDLVITDGSSEKRVPLNGARHPDWSPDGRLILLDHPDGVVRAYHVDSGEIAPVGNARGQDPDWLRGGNGFLTTWQGSGDDAPSVYQWDPEGRVGTKLTGRDEVREPTGNW